jgi:hypothetical protein
VFGAWITFAAVVPVMVEHPFETWDGVWPSIATSPAVETVQWMALVAVLAFGGGLVASRFLLAPVERWWAAVWDRRLWMSENDGGFTFWATMLLGIGVFMTKGAFMGFGFLTARSAPVSMSWLFSGMLFVYYVGLYVLNARMFAAGRLHPLVAGLDLVATFYEVLSGSKGRFATFVIFPIIMLAVFQRGRVSWRSAVIFGAMVFVSAFVVYPALVSYRGELVASTDPTRPAVGLLRGAAGNWSEDYEDKMGHVFLNGAASEEVVASTSLVYFEVHRDSDILWQRMLAFMVPRSVWLDKPMELKGNELGVESYRVMRGDDGTSVIQTGIGELFVYFGSLGALAFFLAGLVMRWVDVAVTCFRGSELLRLGVSAYVFRTLPAVVTMEFETAVTGALSSVLVLWALLALLGLAATLFSGATALQLKGKSLWSLVR